jgi:hypothetical protein
MKRSDLYPSKWLKGATLAGDTNLTITALLQEELGDERQEKPVLYFKEVEQGLVLNLTNFNTIADLYGDETDTWVGKKITLYPTEVTFSGKTSMGIRIRARVPGIRPVQKTAPIEAPPEPEFFAEPELSDETNF